jgi:hypothetical protein
MKDAPRLTISPVFDQWDRPIGYSWEIVIPSDGRDIVCSGCAPPADISDTPSGAWKAAIRFAMLLQESTAPTPIFTDGSTK